MNRELLEFFVDFFVAVCEWWNGSDVLSGLGVFFKVSKLHFEGIVMNFLGFEAMSHVV